MSPLNFARAVITSSFKKKRQKSKITATGGTTSTPGNGYKIHTFTTPGTFTITSGYDDVEYLLVGGGGGGEGADNAGSSGGGAGAGGGGVLIGSILLSEGNYPLVVGLGGTGATAKTTPLFFKVSGNFGDPSSFYGMSAGGGGFGGSGSPPSGARKSGTPQQNLGGTASPGTQQPGAGGGGAGAPGVPDAVQSPGGDTACGGIGITTNFSGVSVVYGSGGGGGRGDGSPTWPATFGRGGTGAGDGGDTGVVGGNATGIGGGGGGGGVGSSPTVGGADGGDGAPGIVILRYLL